MPFKFGHMDGIQMDFFVALGLVAIGIFLWFQFTCFKYHFVWKVARELCQGKSKRLRKEIPQTIRSIAWSRLEPQGRGETRHSPLNEDWPHLCKEKLTSTAIPYTIIRSLETSPLPTAASCWVSLSCLSIVLCLQVCHWCLYFLQECLKTASIPSLHPKAFWVAWRKRFQNTHLLDH